MLVYEPLCLISGLRESIVYISLGSHVVRSADDCACSMAVADAFGRTQGYEIEVSLLIDNEVVWLEVPHHYFLRQEVLEQDYYAGSIELAVCDAQ